MNRIEPRDPSAAHDGRLDVIPGLVDGLRPVRPVRLTRVVSACLGLQLAVTATAVWIVGLRPDFSARIGEPGFLVFAAALVAGGVMSAAAAFRAGIPGREPRVIGGVLPLYVLPLVLAAAIVFLAPTGRDWLGWRQLVSGCWSCVGVTLAAAVVPWVVAIALLSRLAPLWHVRAGLLVGLSAFFLGALVSELHCPNSSVYHIAFAHYLPVAFFSALGCAAAVLLLRRCDVRRGPTDGPENA